MHSGTSTDTSPLAVLSLFRREKAEPSESQTPTLHHTSTRIGSTTRSRQKTLRDQVSVRERQRCAIIGALDHRVAFSLTEEQANDLRAQGTLNLATIEAAHIIPFCFNNFRDAVPQDLVRFYLFSIMQSLSILNPYPRGMPLERGIC